MENPPFYFFLNTEQNAPQFFFYNRYIGLYEQTAFRNDFRNWGKKTAPNQKMFSHEVLNNNCSKKNFEAFKSVFK